MCGEVECVLNGLKHKPGECTPEQIKECHGDVKKHPCEK